MGVFVQCFGEVRTCNIPHLVRRWNTLPTSFGFFSATFKSSFDRPPRAVWKLDSSTLSADQSGHFLELFQACDDNCLGRGSQAGSPKRTSTKEIPMSRVIVEKKQKRQHCLLEHWSETPLPPRCCLLLSVAPERHWILLIIFLLCPWWIVKKWRWWGWVDDVVGSGGLSVVWMYYPVHEYTSHGS